MSQIRIDAVQKSKSGKAWQVRSGESWYTAYLDSGIDRHVGEVVDVEIKTFGKDGRAIDKYKVVSGTPSETPRTALAAPIAPGMGQPPYWLAFASNTVNAAIGAKIITEPAQIKAWVFACKNAAEGAVSGDVSF